MKKILFILISTLAFNLAALSQTNYDNFKAHLKKIESVEKFNAVETTFSKNVQALDSIINIANQAPNSYYSTYKYLYYYDQFGKDTLALYFTKLQPNNPWLLTSKYRNFYDNKKRLIKNTSLIFNSNTLAWENNSKNEYIYNSEDHITKATFSTWDSNINLYVDIFITEMEYDNNGNIIKETHQSMDYNTNLLSLSYKVERSYNNQNLVEQEISFLHNNTTNTWRKLNKVETIYSSSNKITQQLFSQFNTNTNIWDSLYNETTLYDITDHLINKLRFTYQQPNWNISIKETRSYNQTYDTLYIININYNINSNNDSLASKTDYYFQNNNPIQLNHYSYNNTIGAWVKTHKDIKAYDNNYLVSDAIFPSNQNEFNSINNIITSSTFLSYDSASASFLNTYDKQYYYSQKTIVSVNNSAKISSKVFPNPVKSTLYIKFNNKEDNRGIIEIFDISGKLVLSNTINTTSSIKVEHLKSGIYFYKTINKNRVSSGKFIKQ